MPTIRFVDMWRDAEQLFGELLGLIPGARLVHEGSPDILIYSVFGDSHKGIPAGLKVAVNWESSASYQTPSADLMFTSSFEPGSVWAPLLINNTKRLRDTFHSRPRTGTQGFASMLFSHCTGLRMKFAARLLERCSGLGVLVGGGNQFSNTSVPRWGDCGMSKLEWMCGNRCLFNICPENSLHPGYATEKARDAYLTRHIPVYWGCRDRLGEYMPEGSCIHLDPQDMDGTIDRMLEVWESPAAQEEMLSKAPVGKLCERTSQEIMAGGILMRTGGLLARLSGFC